LLVSAVAGVNVADPAIYEFDRYADDENHNRGSETALYEEGALSARLAYNWRDEYASATSGDAGNRPLIVRAMGQLDASISYELSSAVTIGLDAQNLTRSELKDYYGTPILPKSVNAFDRTFELSVRARF
jgi:iron complex outermembrane recepter protein